MCQLLNNFFVHILVLFLFIKLYFLSFFLPLREGIGIFIGLIVRLIMVIESVPLSKI